jgi:N-acyl-D-amino-acid deacylase
VLLGYWSRDKKIMSVEQAVHRLTKAQADFFSIRERGELKVGNYADLLLFDLNKVGRGNKRRLNDLPAKATRVATEAIGVEGVWVNGIRVADKTGALNTATPGTLLRDCAMA